jgi:hypothetical protein
MNDLENVLWQTSSQEGGKDSLSRRRGLWCGLENDSVSGDDGW